MAIPPVGEGNKVGPTKRNRWEHRLATATEARPPPLRSLRLDSPEAPSEGSRTSLQTLRGRRRRCVRAGDSNAGLSRRFPSTGRVDRELLARLLGLRLHRLLHGVHDGLLLLQVIGRDDRLRPGRRRPRGPAARRGDQERTNREKADRAMRTLHGDFEAEPHVPREWEGRLLIRKRIVVGYRPERNRLLEDAPSREPVAPRPMESL